MTYNYKCDKCEETSEVFISMADITGSKGRVDVRKMDERIFGRICHCGGELLKLIEAHDFSFKEAGQYERARKMRQEFSGFD